MVPTARAIRPVRSLLLLAALAAVGTGCSHAKTYTFDVNVTNKLAQPVTVWITKSRGPFEPSWEPPEMIAANTAVGAEKPIGGVQLPPGQSAGTKMTGSFESGNYAVLRVYQATGFDTLLGISPGNPRRLDVTLTPGPNDYVITTENGALTAKPAGAR